jgi:hypothetical protein
MATKGLIVDDVCVVEAGSGHKWYVLLAIFDSNRRHHQMSARSPRGPPRVF